VLDEIIDVEAAVEESSLSAVDETNVRGGDDHIFQTGFAQSTHGGSLAEAMKTPCFLS
jgi:hypothetical protein